MYKDDIRKLIEQSPLDIDTEIQVTGHPPTMASSSFLTNKEQGDWAERVVFTAINEFSKNYFAVQYGRSDSVAAGDAGFSDFYKEHQDELNTIGKRPDILIFKLSDFPNKAVDTENDEHVGQSVAALEVRSSSFLLDSYKMHMDSEQKSATIKCKSIIDTILNSDLGVLLKRKSEPIYQLLYHATDDTLKELDFRRPSWSSTPEAVSLTEQLKHLKENIKILHRRDYLSITPKIEDIALVNRWIQKYNVKHFYLQVFFDKAYVISFLDVLNIISDDTNEGSVFSIERDVKNQRKTTIKVNVNVGKEIIGRIDIPEHKSVMKKLHRGRLLFYVTFKGGKGYLDQEVFTKDIINA